MSRKRKTTPINEVINLVYVLAIFLGAQVWSRTGNFTYGVITFGVGIAVLFAGVTYYKERKNQRLLESGIDIIDNMRGNTFEKFLLLHFENIGYKGDLTPASADYGADLVLEKDGRKIVVQAKRWKQSVGIEAVQQVSGAIKHYNADKGMVITNSIFTENAYNLAASNGVELWDRKKLTDFLRESKGKELAGQLAKINNEGITPSEVAVSSDNENCPKCGSKLVMRNGKKGKFWGCSGFPKCRFTKDLLIISS